MATIELGATNVGYGMQAVSYADSHTSVLSHPDGGVEMRRFTDYMYFSVDDQVLYRAVPSDPVDVEMEYFDEGYDTFYLQYDAVGWAYQGCSTGGRAETNTLTLILWRCRVADAWFGNRQNAGADFRLATTSGKNIDVNRVRIFRAMP